MRARAAPCPFVKSFNYTTSRVLSCVRLKLKSPHNSVIEQFSLRPKEQMFFHIKWNIKPQFVHSCLPYFIAVGSLGVEVRLASNGSMVHNIDMPHISYLSHQGPKIYLSRHLNGLTDLTVLTTTLSVGSCSTISGSEIALSNGSDEFSPDSPGSTLTRAESRSPLRRSFNDPTSRGRAFTHTNPNNPNLIAAAAEPGSLADNPFSCLSLNDLRQPTVVPKLSPQQAMNDNNPLPSPPDNSVIEQFSLRPKEQMFFHIKWNIKPQFVHSCLPYFIAVGSLGVEVRLASKIITVCEVFQVQSDPDLVASSGERNLGTKSGLALNRGQIPDGKTPYVSHSSLLNVLSSLTLFQGPKIYLSRHLNGLTDLTVLTTTLSVGSCSTISGSEIALSNGSDEFSPDSPGSTLTRAESRSPLRRSFNDPTSRGRAFTHTNPNNPNLIIAAAAEPGSLADNPFSCLSLNDLRQPTVVPFVVPKKGGVMRKRV
eukprot:sb/3464253/